MDKLKFNQLKVGMRVMLTNDINWYYIAYVSQGTVDYITLHGHNGVIYTSEIHDIRD